MLAKPVADDPGGPALRAQVGRLPVDHLPRRRRGRDRQPQRAADDPLLPRGGRGGAGELPAAGGDRRRDHRRRHRGNTLDFEALQQRIHPAASRVKLLSEQTPASFVAFDLLALGDDDLTDSRWSERRAALEQALADARRRPRHPATSDSTCARRWFQQFEGAGLDGLIAKPLDLTYQPDKRVMSKIKHERTADCVVAGYRLHKSGPDAIGSLLLGLL